MIIKDFETKTVQLVLDDTTFQILESNNPKLEKSWNLWLDEGFDSIGLPEEKEEDIITIELNDDLVKLFPQESINPFQDILNKMGFFIEE